MNTISSYFVKPGISEQKIGVFTQTKIEIIEKIVCEYIGSSPDQLRVKSRKRNLVFSRHIIFFLLRRYTHMSLLQIANHYGFVDHTTVIHGINNIGNLMENDSILKRQVAQMSMIVKNSGVSN